jgi:regulator of cell morphogenesis and NO signaling
MRRRKKCNPQFKLSVPNTEPKRSRSTQPDIAHSDHVLALELTPLGTLCRWLEDQQRVCLRRDLAHLERLIRLMPPHDARNRQQLVKLRTAFLSFQRKFAAHLKTEAKVVFPLIRQMESNLVGDPHASRSLQTRTTRLERQHFEADEALAEVKALAADETVLFSTSSRVQTLRNCLASFDRNLQEQIYLENRVLFPRALAISRA